MKLLPRLGFSLIELLVVTIITLTVLGLAIAGYRRFAQKQALESAADGVRNNLRLARSWAMASRKINCPNSTSLAGYRVNFSTHGYVIVERCDNGDEVKVRTYSVGDDITISGADAVEFQVLNGEASSSATITLTKNGLSEPITVSVANTGQIQ